MKRYIKDQWRHGFWLPLVVKIGLVILIGPWILGPVVYYVNSAMIWSLRLTDGVHEKLTAPSDGPPADAPPATVHDRLAPGRSRLPANERPLNDW